LEVRWWRWRFCRLGPRGAYSPNSLSLWPRPFRHTQERPRADPCHPAIALFCGAGTELADYVPELMTAERRRYPAIGHVQEVLGGSSGVTVIPVPIDCVDGFTEAYYARPESFLDSDVRQSQSAWEFVGADSIDRAMNRLRRDLESGKWDERNGSLRSQPEFFGSLRLIISTPR
jgi:hypothetical protein